MTEILGPPSRFVPLPFGPTAVSVLAFNGDSLLGGFSVKESTGIAPAECWIIDGQIANGLVIAVITLTAGQSVRDLMPQPGVLVRNALSVQMIAGSVQGSLWVIDQ